MDVHVLPRRGGKTERLLEWLQTAPSGEHRVLVSPTIQESHRLMRLAYDRGLIPGQVETWQFVSFGEVTRGTRGLFSGVLLGRGGHVVLGLDNVDAVLQAMTDWPIEAMTVTGSAR